MRFIKYYLVSCITISIFISQIFMVNNGMNRWKGGGFGMYADYHPFQYDLKINNKTIPRNLRNQTVVKNFLYYPNSKNEEALISFLKLNKDSLEIKIYRPNFNVEDLRLSKKLIYEKSDF